jgi:hypothetical protein
VRLCTTYPTPPSLTSAVRESDAAHLLSRSSSIVPRATKSASRANGMRIDGDGGVSGRSGAGSQLARAWIHRAFDDLPGEAWNEAWTGPLMVCACRPALAWPKAAVEAIVQADVQG